MPRQLRNDIGGTIYHVINRANAKIKIFEDISDYELFEVILIKAVERFSINLYAHNNMPNHFHLVVYSEKDNELGHFMQWLTSTFTQRWHMKHGTIGTGHLFQGRYKSFPVHNSNHLLQVLLYVERNALRANLVEKAEDWRWSSIWIKTHGNEKQQTLFSDWPVEISPNYINILNKKDEENILKDIRFSVTKSVPIGREDKRPRGRPRKK